MRTGKRTITAYCESPFPVHPRAYGEEVSIPAIRALVSGSPPCVRGRGQFVPARLRFARFTPVRTGKSPSRCRIARRAPVHPRAYGEESAHPSGKLLMGGSPPCVRGRAPQPVDHTGCVRFTPVRTGKSCRLPSAFSAPAVHPRAYGEEAMPSFDRLSVAGSPPCVRGRDFQSTLLLNLWRFTPVRTGKRSARHEAPRR